MSLTPVLTPGSVSYVRVKCLTICVPDKTHARLTLSACNRFSLCLLHVLFSRAVQLDTDAVTDMETANVTGRVADRRRRRAADPRARTTIGRRSFAIAVPSL